MEQLKNPVPEIEVKESFKISERGLFRNPTVRLERSDFDLMKEYISFLENQVQNLQEKNQSFEESIVNYENQVQSLQEKNQSLEEDVSSLRKILFDNHERERRLSNKIIRLEEKIKDHRNFNPDFEKIEEMTEQLKEFRKNMIEKIKERAFADVVTWELKDSNFQILNEYNVLSDFMENENTTISFIDDNGKVVTGEIKFVEEYHVEYENGNELLSTSYSHTYVGVELPEKEDEKIYHIKDFHSLYGDKVKEYQLNQDLQSKVVSLENENRQLKNENLQLKNELAESKEKVNEMVTKARQIINNFKENVQENTQERAEKTIENNKQKELEMELA